MRTSALQGSVGDEWTGVLMFVVVLPVQRLEALSNTALTASHCKFPAVLFSQIEVQLQVGPRTAGSMAFCLPNAVLVDAVHLWYPSRSWFDVVAFMPFQLLQQAPGLVVSAGLQTGDGGDRAAIPAVRRTPHGEQQAR